MANKRHVEALKTRWKLSRSKAGPDPVEVRDSKHKLRSAKDIKLRSSKEIKLHKGKRTLVEKRKIKINRAAIKPPSLLLASAPPRRAAAATAQAISEAQQVFLCSGSAPYLVIVTRCMKPQSFLRSTRGTRTARLRCLEIGKTYNNHHLLVIFAVR